ncbi:hypothetical protein Tco_1205957 [Tanacetum coccineum]
MFWRERAAISWIMMGMGGDDGLGGGNDNEATNENVHEDAPLDVEANNEATVIAEGVGFVMIPLLNLQKIGILLLISAYETDTTVLFCFRFFSDPVPGWFGGGCGDSRAVAYMRQLSVAKVSNEMVNLGTHAVSSGDVLMRNDFPLLSKPIYIKSSKSLDEDQEILRIEMTLLHHLPGTSSTPCAEWFGTPSMSDRGQVVECNSGKFEADSLAIEVDRENHRYMIRKWRKGVIPRVSPLSQNKIDSERKSEKWCDSDCIDIYDDNSVTYLNWQQWDSVSEHVPPHLWWGRGGGITLRLEIKEGWQRPPFGRTSAWLGSRSSLKNGWIQASNW